MEEDSSSTDSKYSTVALILLVLQLFAWLIAIIPLEGYFYGSRAASGPGSGLSAGLTLMFFTTPSMFYIFVSNFYLMMNESLSKPYKYIVAVNFLGLIILLLVINN